MRNPEQIRDLLEEKLGNWNSRKRRSQRELWSAMEWREFHRNRRGRAFIFRRQPPPMIVVVTHIAAAIGYLILVEALSLRSLALGLLLITPSLYLLSNAGSRITWSWQRVGRVIAGAALITLGVALLGEFMDEVIAWWTVSDPQQNWIFLWAMAAVAAALAALGVRGGIRYEPTESGCPLTGSRQAGRGVYLHNGRNHPALPRRKYPVGNRVLAGLVVLADV